MSSDRARDSKPNYDIFLFLYRARACFSSLAPPIESSPSFSMSFALPSTEGNSMRPHQSNNRAFEPKRRLFRFHLRRPNLLGVPLRLEAAPLSSDGVDLPPSCPRVDSPQV